MHYKNAIIYSEDFQFHRGGFSTEGGQFRDVLSEHKDALDLNGAYVLPGLVDIHSHGNCGADFSDGDYNGDLRIAEYLARNGVTAFVPTTMTLPYETLQRAFVCGTRLKKDAHLNAARIIGFNMEGPFLSFEKKGAQNAEHLRLPDYDSFKRLYDACGGHISIVDIAPELPGAIDFIERASRLCTVSIAHTVANYDETKAAIASGASHLTHLFNAMPQIHHREPGVIGACSEIKNLHAELICDGQHVHPSAVRMAFTLFGADRICLVSDALRCCGMPDGEYECGGQQVFLNNEVARLGDGSIAGSATNLYGCMKKAISFGISPENAIRAATANPAKAVGAYGTLGSISNGKLSDFIVCSPDFMLLNAYIGGIEVISRY